MSKFKMDVVPLSEGLKNRDVQRENYGISNAELLLPKGFSVTPNGINNSNIKKTLNNPEDIKNLLWLVLTNVFDSINEGYGEDEHTVAAELHCLVQGIESSLKSYYDGDIKKEEINDLISDIDNTNSQAVELLTNIIDNITSLL